MKVSLLFVGTLCFAVSVVPVYGAEPAETPPATEATQTPSATEPPEEKDPFSEVRSLIGSGKLDEAVETLDAALKKEPDSPRLQMLRLLAYSYLMRADRVDDARAQLETFADYQLSAGSAPDFARALGILAGLAARDGDAEQALKVIDKYRKRAEDLEGEAKQSILYAVATQRALQLAKMQRPDEARAIVQEQIKTAREASEKEPDRVDLLLNVAAALKTRMNVEDLLDDGKVDEARRELLDFLASQIKDHPDAAGLVQTFFSEHLSLAARLARTDPDQAEALLAPLEKYLEGKEAKDAPAVEQQKTQIESIRKRIETARKMLALIGTPAVFPKDVDAWVNGEGCTPDDLKGKVVLLDFFAVWCGPCISTFPHLRQWYDEFHDQGLVILGITRYYQFGWDEVAARPKREPELKPEQEREATEQFLKHHELKHPIAYVTDSDLQKHYYVSGIPHVVLIDRQGKVRLFRVGSSDKNVADIEEAIKECLAEPVPADVQNEEKSTTEDTENAEE